MGSGASKTDDGSADTTGNRFKKAAQQVIIMNRFWAVEPHYAACLPPEDMRDNETEEDYEEPKFDYRDETDIHLDYTDLLQVLMANNQHRLRHGLMAAAEESIENGIHKINELDSYKKEGKVDLLLLLAHAEMEQDKYDEAQQHVDLALSIAKRPAIICKKAEILLAQNKIDEAESVVKTAIDSFRLQDDDTSSFSNILMRIDEEREDTGIYVMEEEIDEEVAEDGGNTEAQVEDEPREEVAESDGMIEPKPEKEQVVDENEAQGANYASRKIDYSKPDSHAKKCPSSEESTLDKLGKYLTAPFKGDEEMQFRAVFKWIALNIAYDGYGFKSGKYASCQPKAVLKSRRCVCSGYARLFQALCNAAGLQTKIVHGYAKGFGAASKDDVTKSNHAWNHMKIKSSWYLLDATWAAGYLKSNYAFVRRFNNSYWKTPPSRMVANHLPTDPKDQLLSKPITAAKFRTMVALSGGAVEAGLELDSHHENTIKVSGDHLDISLFTNNSTDILLAFNGGFGELRSKFIWTEKEVQGKRTKFTFTLYFPRAKKYTLSVFCGKTGKTYEFALKYTLISSSGCGKKPVFPKAWGQSHHVRLITPKARFLKPNTKIKLFAPDAGKVALISTKWEYLQKSGDYWEGTVSPGKGSANLAVAFGSSGSFSYCFGFDA